MACGRDLVAETLPNGRNGGPREQASAPPAPTPWPSAIHGKAGREPEKSNRTPLLIGIIASILVFAIMTATAAVGFTAGDAGEKGAVKISTPEEAAKQFFLAMERRDTSNLMLLVDPDFVKKFKERDPEGYETWAGKHFFKDIAADVEFEDLTFDTSVDGNTATVSLTGGSASYEDACGNKVEKEATELLPPETTLIKKGGGWYLSIPESESSERTGETMTERNR